MTDVICIRSSNSSTPWFNVHDRRSNLSLPWYAKNDSVHLSRAYCVSVFSEKIIIPTKCSDVNAVSEFLHGRSKYLNKFWMSILAYIKFTLLIESNTNRGPYNRAESFISSLKPLLCKEWKMLSWFFPAVFNG